MCSRSAFRGWWVDPCGGWFVRWCWRFIDEPLTIFSERAVEGLLPRGMHGVDLTIMHLIRGHQADPGVVMILIVPGKEFPAEAPGVLDTAEAFWEAWLVLQGFEVAFGERVVVGRMRAVVRSGDTQRSASNSAVALAFIGPPRPSAYGFRPGRHQPRCRSVSVTWASER